MCSQMVTYVRETQLEACRGLGAVMGPLRVVTVVYCLVMTSGKDRGLFLSDAYPVCVCVFQGKISFCRATLNVMLTIC